jgi:hypothetical protein
LALEVKRRDTVAGWPLSISMLADTDSMSPSQGEYGWDDWLAGANPNRSVQRTWNRVDFPDSLGP